MESLFILCTISILGNAERYFRRLNCTPLSATHSYQQKADCRKLKFPSSFGMHADQRNDYWKQKDFRVVARRYCPQNNF